MKEKVQVFGRALSGMVMPNIGAFIAWGLITALFISTGWFPNETLAKMVDPMSKYLLPLLIAYTGGKVVADHRGGVIGTIVTMGVIVGSDIPMFIGAMIMGPLSAWILKKFDHLMEGKVKAGFEIYFPYILMNPLLLAATIAGGAVGIFVFTIFNVGLTGTASPGSILSILMMCEKHSYLGLILGVLLSAVVSLIIALPILKFVGKDVSLEEATAQKNSMKAEAKGTTNTIKKWDAIKIAFACDAGMGSSAMGATVLKKKVEKAGITDVSIIHTPVSSIPADINIVVTHEELGERAVHSNPNARLILITNFLSAPEYDRLISDLQKIRE